MSPIAIVAAPSVLGLRPSGVQESAFSLLHTGLAERLGAQNVDVVPSHGYSDVRDPQDMVLNCDAIREYSSILGDVVARRLIEGQFLVVLGGDCSILLGTMLALRRRGRYGLVFFDGHSDFYSPETSPTGEAADMDLALVTGRGPTLLTNVEGLRPLVRDEDVVALGHRDAQEACGQGAPSLAKAQITSIDINMARTLGMAGSAAAALSVVTRETEGFWVHLDVDVLSDVEMPAVDYVMPGGLTFQELGEVLGPVVASPSAVGLQVTIFNPRLDPSGQLAVRLVKLLTTALRSRIANEQSPV